ncbi:hypothetical protein EV182_004692, partial [Spiromyces aspiralis]
PTVISKTPSRQKTEDLSKVQDKGKGSADISNSSKDGDDGSSSSSSSYNLSSDCEVRGRTLRDSESNVGGPSAVDPTRSSHHSRSSTDEGSKKDKDDDDDVDTEHVFNDFAFKNVTLLNDVNQDVSVGSIPGTPSVGTSSYSSSFGAVAGVAPPNLRRQSGIVHGESALHSAPAFPSVTAGGQDPRHHTASPTTAVPLHSHLHVRNPASPLRSPVHTPSSASASFKPGAASSRTRPPLKVSTTFNGSVAGTTKMSATPTPTMQRYSTYSNRYNTPFDSRQELGYAEEDSFQHDQPASASPYYHQAVGASTYFGARATNTPTQPRPQMGLSHDPSMARRQPQKQTRVISESAYTPTSSLQQQVQNAQQLAAPSMTVSGATGRGINPNVAASAAASGNAPARQGSSPSRRKSVLASIFKP